MVKFIISADHGNTQCDGTRKEIHFGEGKTRREAERKVKEALARLQKKYGTGWTDWRVEYTPSM